MLPWQQLIENLTGKTKDVAMLTGKFLDETEVVSKYEANETVQARNTVVHTYYAKMILLYVCREHVEANKIREAQSKMHPEASTLYLKLFNSLFSALNCYALALSTGKRKYIGLAKSYRSMIKNFGRAGSPSVPPMLQLLDAEVLMFNKKAPKAMELYEKAQKGFKEQEFFLLRGIVYERMGLAAAEAKDGVAHERFMVEASSIYARYGATMKVNALKAEISSRKKSTPYE